MDEPSSQAPDELNAVLRHVLPEAWRHAVETALTPEGFVFRFRDADGRQHALDARPRDLVPEALVTGEALGYSYTIVDPAIDDATVLDEYRAVLTALAAREHDLLPWMPAPAEAPAAPLPWRGPLPGERPAAAELVAILRGELPEPWRHDLAVSLTQGGFVLQFVDDANVRHALDAREIRPEAPTLVSGRVLSFSYLFVEGGIEETALAGEYRAVLSRLVAREHDLLPWLDSTAPAGGPSVTARVSEQTAEALPDEHPAPAALAAILRDALPEAWRHAVVATLSPGGFLLRFRDADGHQHALDARELRLVPSAFVAGGTLGYSYTLVDPTVVEATVLDGYRAVLTALAAREDELLPWLALSPTEAEGQPTAVLSTPSWKGPFPNERPAPPELEAVVRSALPEAWRHDLAVSLTPDGFILRFRDAPGLRYAFDAREVHPGEPTLVSGRVLAFSYLSLEDGVEEVALAGDYRTALAALAAREDELLPWLALTSAEAAPVLSTPSWKGPFPNERPPPPELEAVVRSALPEAWRHDLAVSLTPDGFILRFSDAQGLRHAFDTREVRPGEPTLVSGRVLAFSYLSLDEGAEGSVLVGEYRTALAALAAREDELLPWLALSPNAAPRLDHLSYPSTDHVLRPAPPELDAIVRATLPETWRRDLSVLLTTSGFVVQFVDAQDAPRAFDVHEIRAGEPSLARGKVLAFCYPLDGEAPEAERIAGVRPVLEALAAREADILPWLRPDDLVRPNSHGFLALITGLLPAAWRAGVEVVQGIDGFTLGFQDEARVRHLLEARRLTTGLPALVRGEQLGFSYRKIDPALNESIMVQQYREALVVLCAHENQIVAEMQETL